MGFCVHHICTLGFDIYIFMVLYIHVTFHYIALLSYNFIYMEQASVRSTMLILVLVTHIVRKSDKSLDMSELTFQAEETARYRLQQQTKVDVIA